MDDQQFRRLALEGIRGSLPEDMQVQWDYHRDSNLGAADFVNNLMVQHQDISTRFVESKRQAVVERQKNIDPAGDLQATNMSNRDVKRLGIVFAIVGAIIGALITAYQVSGRQSDNAGQNTPVATRSNSDTGNNPGHGSINNPANAIDTNSALPSENSNSGGNTESNTAENEANNSSKELPIEAVEDTRVLTVRTREGKASYRPSGEFDFLPLRESGALFEGERIKVTKSSIELESEGLWIEGSDRLDMKIVRNSESGLSMSMATGRAIIRSTRSVEIEVYGNRISFKNASFVLDIRSSGSELFLFDGFVDILREDDFKKVTGPRHVIVSRGLPDRELADREYTALEPKLLGHHRTLLKWDFERGPGVCNVGEWSKGGSRGSSYAMRSNGVAADIGTNLDSSLFTLPPDSMLRFKILTKATQVRISARLQVEDGWIRVSIRTSIPAGEGWKSIVVPLKNLAYSSNRPGTGFKPYASYARLIFTSLTDAGSVFNTPSMLIDDVHIYAPEK